MRYLLLVGHAAVARGIHEALVMLLGPRDFVLVCDMLADEDVQAYRQRLEGLLKPCAAGDEIVVLSDIAGGSPVKIALEELAGKGADVRAFGGANLPMAISALMGLEDGLDLSDVRDALLMDGAQAVKEIEFK